MADVIIEQLSGGQLIELRTSLLSNVRALHFDATVLLGASRFARSNALAVLGFEELAKLFPLWSSGLTSISPEADAKYLRRFMTDHKDKVAVALFGEHLLGAIFGLDHHEDSVVNGLVPLDVLEKEATRLNLRKQAGFYVGFDGHRFSIPESDVDEQEASKMVERLRRTLIMFSAFDGLVGIETPTKQQLLDAKTRVQSEVAPNGARAQRAPI